MRELVPIPTGRSLGRPRRCIASLKVKIGRHTFRATGITAYLEAA